MANTIVVDILADTRSLVKGVNETNAKLGSLNQSAGKAATAFKGIVASLGLSIGISWFKDAIKGAEEEEKTFAALATQYGKDADAIVAKVGNLSKLFYVDDGTIAQLVLNLRGALRAELDPLAADLAQGALVLAKLTNKPLEEISGKLVKFLKDGKLTVKEIQGLGITLTEEQQKAFDAAAKSGKEVQFIIDLLLSEEYKKKALNLITPMEKLNFALNEIKDLVGGKLLKAFDGLFDFFTDKDKNGVTKLNGNFEDTKDILILIAAALVVSKIVTPIILWTKAVQGLTLSNIALNIVLNANPIGLIVLGIVALIAVVILIINHWSDLGKAFKEFADKFVGFFTGIGDIFKKAFAGVSFSGLFDAFKNMINNILNFAKGIGGTFLQIGKDIVQGMINGIGSMISSAINAVKNVASAITNGIKNALGINSPSKVFMNIGMGINEGLVKGIDKTAFTAVNSVKDLGKSLNMPMKLSPIGGLGFAGAGNSAGQPITVNINAGVGTDPYELGRVVRAALDKYAGVNG